MLEMIWRRLLKLTSVDNASWFIREWMSIGGWCENQNLQPLTMTKLLRGTNNIKNASSISGVCILCHQFHWIWTVNGDKILSNWKLVQFFKSYIDFCCIQNAHCLLQISFIILAQGHSLIHTHPYPLHKPYSLSLSIHQYDAILSQLIYTIMYRHTILDHRSLSFSYLLSLSHTLLHIYHIWKLALYSLAM